MSITIRGHNYLVVSLDGPNGSRLQNGGEREKGHTINITRSHRPTFEKIKSSALAGLYIAGGSFTLSDLFFTRFEGGAFFNCLMIWKFEGFACATEKPTETVEHRVLDRPPRTTRKERSQAYHRLARPVKLAVVHIALPVEQVLEQPPQVVIVWRLEKVQATHVPQVVGKLLGVALAQHLDRRGPLRVADLLVALLERFRLQALPRQRAAQEIHEHVTECLQVVPSRLLPPQVRVYRHVPRRARQRLMLPIWYVLIGI